MCASTNCVPSIYFTIRAKYFFAREELWPSYKVLFASFQLEENC